MAEGNGSMASNQVRLGSKTYAVIPQPHPVILRKFPGLIQKIQESAAGTQTEDEGEVKEEDAFGSIKSVVDLLGDRVHDALLLFIPDLMPKHEFAGFPTKQTSEDDQFDEEWAIENAPTLPQVFHAFDTCINVNGGKRLKDLLGNALGPEISRAVRTFVVARMREELSKMSANSPSTKAGSGELTTSGVKSQTPQEQENEDSPLPVS